jgi:predicted DNA-binding protein (UPF0251 family)
MGAWSPDPTASSTSSLPSVARSSSGTGLPIHDCSPRWSWPLVTSRPRATRRPKLSRGPWSVGPGCGLWTPPRRGVHRVAVNVLRRRNRRQILEERFLRRQRPELAPPPQIASGLWDAMESLPFRQRQALALRYLLGMTQAEVADAMGVAPGTAAATLHAARRNLAGRLGTDDADDMEVAARE